MNRSRKLYEAIAIVSGASNRLSLGLNGLKFSKSDTKRLRDKCLTLRAALQDLEWEFDRMIEEETGLTEKQKWVNAARNIGGAQ